MLTRRIIPCLDIKNGRVVKGRRFENLVDAGNPVELARRYSDEGADELVLLDISASLEERKPFFEIVSEVTRRVAIPVTVGGGIKSVEDIRTLLRSGADKVSLNSVLASDPELLSRAVPHFGSQALVAAIDVLRCKDSVHAPRWQVFIRSGTRKIERDGLEWARHLVELGAGELLVTSIDNDGMKQGYDLEFLRALTDSVSVPVIASGGAGTSRHFYEGLAVGGADAVLAASVFHFGEIGISELKQELAAQGLPMRTLASPESSPGSHATSVKGKQS